jgi:carbonic anhydrase
MTMTPNESFQKIAQGVEHFQNVVYKEKESLFKSLATSQKPKVLFITCSDSRIDSALITQTEPGDMFLINNAGNIIPPLGSAHGGVGASIEYAVSVLNVEHIIVCGHSNCGAMNALVSKTNLDNLPDVKHWLSFAKASYAIYESEEKRLSDDERLDYCIKVNVPVQLSHLKTLPSVAAKMVQKKITLHGWVYHIETGDIDVYDEATGSFKNFHDAYALNSAEIPAAV